MFSKSIVLKVLLYKNMTTIHVKGKVEFTILANEFGISHVIKKCVCNVWFATQHCSHFKG